MCRIDDCDSEGVVGTFVQHRKIRPGVVKKCDECGRTISHPEDETYHWAIWAHDGSAYYSEKVKLWFLDCVICEHCWVGTYWLDEVCGGFVYAAILEELEEHWDEELLLRTHSLGRFILNARRRWRRPDGTLLPIPDAITVRAA